MFANLLIILASSLVMIALFRRLRLPPVLGYLCVGLMVGPKAFDWINESEHLPDLAELGVVFLLFSLGLEFSLSKMIALRKVVFRLGSQQVLITTFLLGGVLMLLGMPATPALLMGAGLSLSSTAIVTKELGSLGEIFSSHGQNAVGVLLFQDVVAVLLLTLVPVFAGSSDQAWYWALPLTLLKTVLLFFGLLLASRWLLPRLFQEVAASRSAELFVLLALVIVLLTAWLTHLLGLSPALGAFLFAWHDDVRYLQRRRLPRQREQLVHGNAGSDRCITQACLTNRFLHATGSKFSDVSQHRGESLFSLGYCDGLSRSDCAHRML